jgi:hypothetical protein
MMRLQAAIMGRALPVERVHVDRSPAARRVTLRQQHGADPEVGTGQRRDQPIPWSCLWHGRTVSGEQLIGSLTRHRLYTLPQLSLAQSAVPNRIVVGEKKGALAERNFDEPVPEGSTLRRTATPRHVCDKTKYDNFRENDSAPGGAKIGADVIPIFI